MQLSRVEGSVHIPTSGWGLRELGQIPTLELASLRLLHIEFRSIFLLQPPGGVSQEPNSATEFVITRRAQYEGSIACLKCTRELCIAVGIGLAFSTEEGSIVP